MMLIAILTVRKGAEEKFRAFERHAAAVMKTHGGRIERTVAVAAEGESDVFREVHVVSFPSPQAFAAYRNDERLGQMARLREESVVDTRLLIGEEGPSYDAG
jgi:uncharacterized protein (DUF1330 family)